MEKITTLFPIVPTHVNLQDEEWLGRLLPIENPKNPTEGIFLYVSKNKFDLTNSPAGLTKDVPTPLGIVKTEEYTIARSTRAEAAFLCNYTNKQKDGVMFRFDIFSNDIAEPLLLLRLFSKGDAFVPYAFPSGYSPLRINAEIEEVQSYYHLSQNDLTKFVEFFQMFWTMFRTLDPYTNQKTGSLASWSKKIGNALYFFNKSYFVEMSTVLHPGARKGNIDRLLSLVMALDALLGITPDGDELAKNSGLLLSKLYPDAEKEIRGFYNLRSTWVHANESTLNAYITDTQIDMLRKFVQKACLINIVLFNNGDVRTRFEMSGKKHIIEYLALAPGKIDAAVDVVKNCGERYDL